MKALAVVLAYLSLTACAMFGGGDDKRRSNYVASRSDISPEMRWTIMDGKIMRGMTKEEVIASWGEPCWYCYGTKKASYGDMWEYNVFGTGRYGIGNGTYVFFDPQGVVTGWSGK